MILKINQHKFWSIRVLYLVGHFCSSIYIYIYIKQRPHLRDHEFLPCGTLHEENWNTFKPRKNKFKCKDSLFPLVQCFKSIFVTLLFNVLRLLFVLFSSMFQDFSFLIHTKKLFALSLNSWLSPVARPSRQTTLFGKNWLFTFLLTLLYIDSYTHEM